MGKTKTPTTAPAPETTGAAPTAVQEVETDPWKIMKTVYIPLKRGKYQPDFNGSVNGKRFTIPRGKPWEVPLPIYEVVQDAMKSEEKSAMEYYKLQADLIARSKEEEARILGN